MTNHTSSTDDDCLPTMVRGLRWAFLTVATLGVAAPLGVLVWQAATPNVVLRSAPAGRFVSASASTAFLQPSLTTVDTTEGSLIVRGLFSAPRNQPLEVVGLSQTPGVQLCAVGYTDTCLPLAGAWAGALQPTPAHAHAIDFPHYGLTVNTLALWLFFGGALTFLCGIGWLHVHLELGAATPDSAEPPAITGPGA